MDTLISYFPLKQGISVSEAIARQSENINVDDWLCLTCKNYEGDLRCKKNVFIAFTGANMRGCYFYEHGHKCRHCGRVT